MIRLRSSSYPIPFSPRLARRASGWLVVLLLLPVGLAGQEAPQVTLYTPDGSQQRTLSTPMVVDVGLPSPVTAPVSTVTGTGTGTQTTVEAVVREGTGGQSATSYAAERIWALAADTSGNVWVATNAGLSRFDGQQWTTFTEADGLADDEIISVAVDGQGQVWAGSLNGLTRFDGQRWTRYRLEERGRRRVAVAPNGNVWCLGGEGYLLARYDGQAWRTYAAADMGIEGRGDITEVTALAVDGSGTLWAGFLFYEVTSQGQLRGPVGHTLLTFDGAQWTSYQLDAGMIFPDSQGRVWTNCAGGLCVKEGSTWKRYAETGTGDNTRWGVYGMTEDAAGRLWIAGNYFGVLEGTTWTGFYYEEFGATHAPVIDSRGDLWISSRKGLYRWAQADQPTAIESSAPPGEPRSFHLEQNYPNPFNQTTRIGFTLKQRAAVALQVFNARGQRVATLLQGTWPAGAYQTAWDGRDGQGQAVASGLYIYQLYAGGRQATRKMMLVQ